MYTYRGTATNDETWTETFEVVGADITEWTIECKVGGKDAAVTKLSTTQFTTSLPLSTMQGFCPGSYPVGMRYTENGVTSQVLVGTLSVLEGNFP